MKRGAWMFLISLLVVIAFGVTEMAGLRDWVSVLSGTPVPGVPFEEAIAGGALYVLAWFGAVLLAPILAIAAALSILSRALFERGDARVRSPADAGVPGER